VAKNKPIGIITRGTTNPNRLRRVDRYLAQLDVLKNQENPIVVDLGYGKNPITTLELKTRLEKLNPQIRVVGIEIDPARVTEAKSFENERLKFLHGGFEIPNGFDDRSDVDLVRAFNVLRQYDESEVSAAWKKIQSRLSKNGLIVEGTSDEIGRISSWITLDRERPLYFTISLKLQGLDKPSKVAERLPKALIHKNIPGNKIHSFLAELDSAWNKAAGFASFGQAQRFVKMCKLMIDAGWPIQNNPKRWRLGELTVNFEAVSSEYLK
jgi:hypothetical protein